MDGSAVIQLFMSEEMAQGYQRLMSNGMAQDFSWERRCGDYVELYERMLATPS